ncbi:MAG: hypothetical protein IH984_03690 [Planctomycetes bacterium]|nr:hypothetical protein [Planctomycetota bacterium]
MTTFVLRYFSISVMLVFSSVVCAQKPGQATNATVTAKNQDEAIVRMLQETLVDASYDRIDFDRVVDDWRDRFGLNIHVSWGQLEKVGVRRDHRIEIKLKQVPIETVLDIVLREASGSTDLVKYIVSSGILMISTEAIVREPTVLRTYDVTDLIESGYALRRFANTPVLGLKLTGREFVGGEVRRGGGGGSGGGIYGDALDGPDRLSEMELIGGIIDLLLELVKPDSWIDNGGETGSVRVFDSTFFIRQTIRGHQKVANLFSMIRANHPEPLEGDAAIVRLRLDKAAELRAKIGKSFPHITSQQATQLAWAPNSEGVLFRSTVSGFNGSRLWYSALAQRDIVSGLKATVGDGVNAFVPLTATSTDGFELIVLPLLQPDSDKVTIDVQMAWVPGTKITSRSVALGSSSTEGSIDQTLRKMRTVSSATITKLGDAVIFSIPSQLSDSGESLEYEDWLIVRVRKPVNSTD